MVYNKENLKELKTFKFNWSFPFIGMNDTQRYLGMHDINYFLFENRSLYLWFLWKVTCGVYAF